VQYEEGSTGLVNEKRRTRAEGADGLAVSERRGGRRRKKGKNRRSLEDRKKTTKASQYSSSGTRKRRWYEPGNPYLSTEGVEE
jgi:hypothetical protein